MQGRYFLFGQSRSESASSGKGFPRFDSAAESLEGDRLHDSRQMELGVTASARHRLLQCLFRTTCPKQERPEGPTQKPRRRSRGLICMP
jgi:hypothetical protein